MLDFPFDLALMSSRYGTRIFNGTQSWHSGIDFAVAGGRDVKASDAGVVTKVEYTSLKGYQVEVTHGTTARTRYHMLNSVIPVSVGDSVYKSQVIGKVASIRYSANAAWTGPHLHFEVHLPADNGFRAADPVAHIVRQPNYEFAGSISDPLGDNVMPTVSEIWNTPVIDNPNAPGQVLTAAQFLEWSLRYSDSVDKAVRGVDQVDGVTKTVGQMVGFATAGLRDLKSGLQGVKDDVAAVPSKVWDFKLPHPIQKDSQSNPALVAASAFLRYEPLEHKQTRDKIG